MTLEEKIAMANQVRSRDRFGSVSPEEQAALPGTETELWIKKMCIRDRDKTGTFTGSIPLVMNLYVW